jgi:hypothetical protein
MTQGPRPPQPTWASRIQRITGLAATTIMRILNKQAKAR